jgi:hypothetical protein
MTPLDPQRTIDYAEYLLSLPDSDREIAGNALNTALLAATPDDEIGKPPVRTLGAYLDDPVETPPILVEPGLVAVGAISALTSRGGKGKTAVSLNRLMRWGMGKPLFDELPELFHPTRPLRILIIENEGNGGHFHGILHTILRESDFTDDERATARENIHIWGDGGWSGLKVDRQEDFALVNRAVQETQADLLFVEPFRGLWQGEENSATDMAIVCDQFSEIANTHACGVMLTHHERKSGVGEGDGADPMSAARGSGVLEGAAAVMERWVHVKNGQQSEISCIKNRFDEEYIPVRMEFERQRWGYRYVAEDEKLRDVKKILAKQPGQGFSLAEVAQEMGENEQRTRKWLNTLSNDDEQPVDRQRVANAHVWRYLRGDGDPGDGRIAP